MKTRIYTTPAAACANIIPRRGAAYNIAQCKGPQCRRYKASAMTNNIPHRRVRLVNSNNLIIII